MACLSLEVTPLQPASLEVAASAASLSVSAVPPTLAVTPSRQATLTVTPVVQASLAVTPIRQATLAIYEVCDVGVGGILVVLASTDGPLRTRDGRYILLDPETSPPDE